MGISLETPKNWAEFSLDDYEHSTTVAFVLRGRAPSVRSRHAYASFSTNDDSRDRLQPASLF